MSSTDDTDPDRPSLRPSAQTDPGLGAPRKSVARGTTETAAAAVVSKERDPAASTLPNTTDMLLTGLIQGENEAYFRKAKPAAESSGEAAVAFAAGPRALAPGGETPLPEPPILLRHSLEMDIVTAAEPPPPFVEPPSALFSGPELRSRAMDPTDFDIPLPPPPAAWAYRWLAFALAAVTMSGIGILAVHWLQPTPADTAPAANAPSHALPVHPETAQPPSLPAPVEAIPPLVATPVSRPPGAATLTRTGAKTASPTRNPSSVPTRTDPAPVASPLPKDDVKRQM